MCCLPVPTSFGKAASSPSIRILLMSTNCRETRAAGKTQLMIRARSPREQPLPIYPCTLTINTSGTAVTSIPLPVFVTTDAASTTIAHHCLTRALQLDHVLGTEVGTSKAESTANAVAMLTGCTGAVRSCKGLSHFEGNFALTLICSGKPCNRKPGGLAITSARLHACPAALQKGRPQPDCSGPPRMQASRPCASHARFCQQRDQHPADTRRTNVNAVCECPALQAEWDKYATLFAHGACTLQQAMAGGHHWCAKLIMDHNS